MRYCVYLAAILALLVSPAARAADVAHGEAIYKLWCDDCHTSEITRPGIPPPGWNVLQKRYKGTDISPVISERTDLTPAYIKTMVRHGMNIMPRTRKTEISDEDLADLVAYLTRNNK